jgi:serine phosphatase RsbU (regulator of sigma subunit)
MKRRIPRERKALKLGLRPRFVFTVTLALASVVGVAIVMVNVGTAEITRKMRGDLLSEAVVFSNGDFQCRTDESRMEVHPTGVRVIPFTYNDFGKGRAGEGTLYSYESTDEKGMPHRFELRVPEGEDATPVLQSLMVGVMVAVLVAGAAAALWAAEQVVRPVHKLVEDVRQIALGNLHHRTMARGPGEIQLLGWAIDRMTQSLREAQETKVELSVRERELELAGGVREALLPQGTPLIEGYDLGSSFLPSPRFGGDFHDFVERPDGRIGLLVCDVGGRGVPAALVGATARSYLRSELLRVGEVAESFARINRWLAGDMRRGMFVSAIYALLDPKQGLATVACAGHKIPLLRVSASDGNLRVVHPDGIALGFDKGPVFERRLQVVEVPLEPGDRIVLANSAPVRLKNAQGEELGEKAFYARVRKHHVADTTQFLRTLRRDLEQFASPAGFQEDIAFVTVRRSE